MGSLRNSHLIAACAVQPPFAIDYVIGVGLKSWMRADDFLKFF